MDESSLIGLTAELIAALTDHNINTMRTIQHLSSIIDRANYTISHDDMTEMMLIGVDTRATADKVRVMCDKVNSQIVKNIKKSGGILPRDGDTSG